MLRFPCTCDEFKNWALSPNPTCQAPRCRAYKNHICICCPFVEELHPVNCFAEVHNSFDETEPEQNPVQENSNSCQAFTSEQLKRQLSAPPVVLEVPDYAPKDTQRWVLFVITEEADGDCVFGPFYKLEAQDLASQLQYHWGYPESSFFVRELMPWPATIPKALPVQEVKKPNPDPDHSTNKKRTSKPDPTIRSIRAFFSSKK